MNNNKWIAHENIKEGNSINLLCFIFDGGSAGYFATWKYGLSDTINLIPILYPVREKRKKEEMYKDMEAFVTDLVMCLGDVLKGRYAFFGYCSGAVIAYEVAALAKKLYGVDPEYGMIISSEAPKYLCNSIPICTKDNEKELFYNHMRVLPTISNEMLEDKLFMEYYAPLMVADYKLLRTYMYKKHEMLNCDFDVIICSSDSKINRKKVEEWEELTTGKTVIIDKEGGHFLVETQKEYIFDKLNERLSNKVAVKRKDVQSTTKKEINNLTDIEREVIDIWEKVFGISDFIPTDNFFYKGGDSFKAAKIINLINQKFDIRLNINDIFNYPQIKMLGKYISTNIISKETETDNLDEGEI